MPATNETFTERVDVSTQPEGAFIGRMEIEIWSDKIREAGHREEVTALRDRIGELERENAALREKR